ncbi:MAG TPA: hypothetical protein ENH01_05960 [Nitrospirae bacterium]|nr:hypothetical protein [Nitrospirota bacterium]
MNINEYISKLEALINSSSAIASYSLNIDRKTAEIVFISGKIEFRNDSILDFKEFIESTEKAIEKYKYAYNYRKGSNSIFRYDNAPDPRAKDIKTFPDHKHLKDGSIIQSEPIELSEVLNEIEGAYIIKERD